MPSLLEWTETNRRFSGQLPEIILPLRAIYADNHPDIVLLKAAQVFISEWLINNALWVCDVGWAKRGNALYVMPNQTHMDDFSQGRIGEAIQQSPTLKKRITSNRTRLRKLGSQALYMRGSETVIQTRSIDADLLVLDEVDLFVEGAVEKSKERLGSSRAPLWRAASQPTYPEIGIDVLYEDSDKRKWFIRCKRCNYDQTLTWDDNVTFSTNLKSVKIVCAKCKRPLDPLSPGHWVAEYPDRDVHGYHINKLMSPRADLKAMLGRFTAVEDVQKLQSFYNADLGIPYRPRGTKPDISDFERQEYNWKTAVEESYMGVDVGMNLHVSVLGRDRTEQEKKDGVNLKTKPYRLIEQIYVQTFEDLEALWLTYQPKYTVIDAKGDPRATDEWAQRRPFKVFRWQHHQSKTEPDWDDDNQLVKFDRTSMLDLLYSWGRARPAKLLLHSHITPDFVSQLTALVREIIKNNDGRLVPRYVSARPDHYAFSLAFAIMAASEFGESMRTMSISAPAATERVPSMVGRSFSGAVKPRWTGSSIGRKSRF